MGEHGTIARTDMATRPGLAKGRRPALVEVRAGQTRVRTVDARWREAFERADVVSEGAAREEAHSSGGHVWYGSTSVILAVGGDDTERGFLAAVADRDLHVRARVLRIAVREAAARASSPPCQGRLGRSQCEIRVSADPQGVRIDVDVQAPLIEGSAAPKRART